MRRTLAALALATVASLITAPALAASIAKVAKAKNQIVLRLSEEEQSEFMPGMKVLVETESPKLVIAGEMMSLTGADAKVWLDGKYPELRPKMTAKLSSRNPGAAPTAAGGVAGYPGKSVLQLTKSYISSPFNDEIDNEGLGTTSAHGNDLIYLGAPAGYMRLGWLYSFGQFHLGPEFAYFSQSQKVKVVSTPEEGDSTESEETAKLTYMEFGLLGKFHFLPLAPYSVNPFGQLGFGYGSSSINYEDDEPATGKITIVRVGLGASYFMTPGLSGDFALEYRKDSMNVTYSQTTEVKNSSGTVTETSVNETQVAGSFTTINFVYGLSFYF